MPRNKLNDLHNHLFEALERLNDDSLSGEALDKEIKKSGAITDVAKTIIQNGELALKTMKFADEYGGSKDILKLPFLLEE